MPESQFISEYADVVRQQFLSGHAREHAYLPLLIVVSGAPGTGKTTLAAKIAAEMHVLHIERDTFFQSLEHASGGQIDRPKVGIPLFYKVLSDLLGAGVSLVMDGTLYKDTSEKGVAQLQNLADVVNIHCRADKAARRFYEREVERAKGTAPEWLEAHMVKLQKIKPLVEHPLEIDWDVVEVETNNGYEPSIQEVVATLRKRQPIRRTSTV